MCKSKKTITFIKKAQSVHGDKYDYSNVIYKKHNQKVDILCPQHGIFKQSPNSHTSQKSGCPECAKIRVKKSLSSSTKKFIRKATKKHGNTYDYSKVNYTNSRTKVTIICPTHGEFKQLPYYHCVGQGCQKCYFDKISMSKSEFFTQVKKAHENTYTYKESSYTALSKKILITCPQHGEFKQLAHHHLKGCGCPKCAGNVKKSKQQFVKDAKKIHNDKYDYSLVDYINSSTKITIICPKHGEFEQVPHSHLNGNGCSQCAGCAKKNTKQFTKDAKKIHGDKYDYSKSVYINNRSKITIICPKHGEFEQNAFSHVNGSGCPQCNESKGEKIVASFLDENEIIYQREFTFDGFGNKKPYRYDFFLPNHNMLIEYHGLQHYEPVEYFGGKKAFKNRQISDQIKEEYAKSNNINLIVIPYNEFCNITTILQNYLNI